MDIKLAISPLIIDNYYDFGKIPLYSYIVFSMDFMSCWTMAHESIFKWYSIRTSVCALRDDEKSTSLNTALGLTHITFYITHRFSTIIQAVKVRSALCCVTYDLIIDLNVHYFSPYSCISNMKNSEMIRKPVSQIYQYMNG